MNRRTFLKSAALVAAAPTILRAEAPNAAGQFTTALVGCGWWGSTGTRSSS